MLQASGSPWVHTALPPCPCALVLVAVPLGTQQRPNCFHYSWEVQQSCSHSMICSNQTIIPFFLHGTHGPSPHPRPYLSVTVRRARVRFCGKASSASEYKVPTWDDATGTHGGGGKGRGLSDRGMRREEGRRGERAGADPNRCHFPARHYRAGRGSR